MIMSEVKEVARRWEKYGKIIASFGNIFRNNVDSFFLIFQTDYIQSEIVILLFVIFHHIYLWLLLHGRDIEGMNCILLVIMYIFGLVLCHLDCRDLYFNKMKNRLLFISLFLLAVKCWNLFLWYSYRNRMRRCIIIYARVTL